MSIGPNNNAPVYTALNNMRAFYGAVVKLGGENLLLHDLYRDHYGKAIVECRGDTCRIQDTLIVNGIVAKAVCPDMGRIEFDQWMGEAYISRGANIYKDDFYGGSTSRFKGIDLMTPSNMHFTDVVFDDSWNIISGDLSGINYLPDIGLVSGHIEYLDSKPVKAILALDQVSLGYFLRRGSSLEISADGRATTINTGYNGAAMNKRILCSSNATIVIDNETGKTKSVEASRKDFTSHCIVDGKSYTRVTFDENERLRIGRLDHNMLVNGTPVTLGAVVGFDAKGKVEWIGGDL